MDPNLQGLMIDDLARGRRPLQVADFHVGALARISTIGTRIFGGRMGTFDNTTQKTFNVCCTLAQKFDAVRLIFANGNTGGTLGIGVTKVSVRENLATFNNSNNSWTAVTFAGSSTGTVAAAPGSNRRSYLLSDWIEINSLDRDDGGTFPVLYMRSYISTSGSITIMGNGTDDFTNWVTRPNGRIWCMRYQNGDQCTTPSGFTDTTNRSQCPIVGVQYAARGQVITVMGVGDSITEGRGTYLGEGWGVPACEGLSSMSGVAFEWSNVAWSGVSTGAIRDQVIDVLGAGIYPELMFIPTGSPNDVSTTVTSAQVLAMRTRLARALVECRAYQVRPVLWTWLPSNPAAKDYGSTDSLRVALNSDVVSWARRGVDVLDYSAALEGTVDGDGQMQFASSVTTDNIHPNDAGNAILVPLAQQPLRKYVAI